MRIGMATAVIVAVVSVGVLAQGGGGARGGGAPAPAPMMLTSSALTDMGNLPVKYSCAGTPANFSPPLAWSNAPAGTASFVLLVHDLEPRPGKNLDDILHWLVWNIPGSTMSMAENAPATPTLPDGSTQVTAQGRNGGAATSYRGPCPPPLQPHHYSFEVFALDQKLESPAGATRADVTSAMNGHILGHAVLMTRFERQP